MYADFVRQVDPRGSITDQLIQSHVVNVEVAEQLRKKETRHDSCRSMLHELLSSGNPRAFIELRKALEEDYPYIVNRMDEATPVTLSQTELQKSYQQNEELKAVIKNKDDEIASQKKTIMEELTKNHEVLLKKNSELAHANEKLRKVEESERKLRVALVDKQRENKSKDLLTQLADKDKKITDVKSQLMTTQTQNKDLLTQIVDKDKKITDVESQLKTTQTQNKDLLTQIVDKDKKIADVESQLKTVQTQNQDLLSQLHDREREIAQLRDTVRVAEADADTVADTSSEVVRDEVDDLKCQLSTPQQRYDEDTESLRAEPQHAADDYGI